MLRKSAILLTMFWSLLAWSHCSLSLGFPSLESTKTSTELTEVEHCDVVLNSGPASVSFERGDELKQQNKEKINNLCQKWSTDCVYYGCGGILIHTSADACKKLPFYA